MELWFVAYPVAGQVAFGIFLICALAEGNKSPLDILDAESELIAAYNVEYSGIKFALFYAGEYAHTLALCALAATVFLGGYLGPSFLPGFVWLTAKCAAPVRAHPVDPLEPDASADRSGDPAELDGPAPGFAREHPRRGLLGPEALGVPSFRNDPRRDAERRWA